MLDLVPVAASCFVMIIAQSAAASRVFAERYHEPVDTNADMLGLAAANAAAAFSGRSSSTAVRRKPQWPIAPVRAASSRN